MRWSADRLRWGLIGGVLLLLALLAGFFGVARYRARVLWQQILARNGVSFHRDTTGFTYSQSSGGRTVFTVHASKATPLGNGRYTLKDAVLILYGREPGRDDRIYGHEFQYDQNQGIARAVGEVHLDLQTPSKTPGGSASAADLSFAPEVEGAQDQSAIHVRTSGLVYERGSGLATTAEHTEFRYGGITCVSKGAEFDTKAGKVLLPAEVHMSGNLRETPFTLQAGRVELDREQQTARLEQPDLTSGDRSATAQSALLHLNKDGSVRALEAHTNVELKNGSEQVQAPAVTADFGVNNHLHLAHFSGGTRFAETDPQQPSKGRADSLELRGNAAGDLQSALATGMVVFDQQVLETAGGTPGVVTGRRHLEGQRAEVSFRPQGKPARSPSPERLHVAGGAKFVAASRVGKADAGWSSTEIGGDDLVTVIAARGDGQLAPETVQGKGHTRLEQLTATGERRVSTGDQLEVNFVPAGGGPGAGQAAMQVASAVQSGGVQVETWGAPQPGGEAKGAPVAAPEPSTARADRAAYDGQQQLLRLYGSTARPASIRSEGNQLTAQTITLEQASGNSEASGHVSASNAGEGGEAPSHLQAERAQFVRQTGVSEFVGSDREPARLWQGGSQVEAAHITLDRNQQRLVALPESAGGVVHAVFATEPPSPRPGPKEGSPSASAAPQRAGAVRVQARRMEYSDKDREATFTGGVVLRGSLGDIVADRAAAFLAKAPAPGKANGAKVAPTGAAAPAQVLGAGQAVPGLSAGFSGSLERLVVLGGVRLRQQEPSRMGFGEQLTYTAQDSRFVLTGTPGKLPRVVGDQGTVTGATLIFGGADSTIVVAGEPGGSKAGAGGRVHTETDLKQP